MKFIKKIATRMGLTVLALLPMYAMAAVSDATNFTVNATVEQSFGLMCSTGSSADQPCSPDAIAFGSFPASAYTSAAHTLYLKATIGTNSTLSSDTLYYKIADSASGTGRTCGNGGENACFLMTGTSNPTNTLPLEVSYQACVASAAVVQPNTIEGPLSNNNTSIVKTGACTAYNQGSATPVTSNPGANLNQGVLAFTIPEQDSPPAVDTYSDSLTMTICTTDLCT